MAYRYCAACGTLDDLSCSNHNPDHDSIFLRFEQLENLFKGKTDMSWQGMQDAIALIKLLRAQVLK